MLDFVSIVTQQCLTNVLSIKKSNPVTKFVKGDFPVPTKKCGKKENSMASTDISEGSTKDEEPLDFDKFMNANNDQV